MRSPFVSSGPGARSRERIGNIGGGSHEETGLGPGADQEWKKAGGERAVPLKWLPRLRFRSSVVFGFYGAAETSARTFRRTSHARTMPSGGGLSGLSPS